MTVGRERERSAIAALLDAARSGNGSTLTIVGDPGIGKTTMLDEARLLASDFTVLSASGVETEAQLLFAALNDLLIPVAATIDALPERQAAALRGALALGPVDSGSELAVTVAAHGVLVAASLERPLLVLVDDCQWIDPATVIVLAYVARRLAGHRVAFVAASRADVVPGWFGDHQRLSIEPLTVAEAQSVLDELLPDLPAEAASNVVATSAGNPLALREIAGSLGPEQRLGLSPFDPPLKTAGRLSGLFDARLRGLPPTTCQALLVAALSPTGLVEELQKAWSFMGLPYDSVEAAEEVRLVSVDDSRVRFAHPLVRSAVFHLATAPEHRRAHRALAEGADPDARPWHLAASSSGPDELIADELFQLGVRARDRRAYAASSLAFEAAAARSVDERQRVEGLERAAVAAWRTGDTTRSTTMTRRAIELAEHIDQRLADRLRVRFASLSYSVESYEDSYGVLTQLVARDELDPELSLVADVELARVCLGSARYTELPAVIARARSKVSASTPASVRF